MAQKKYNTSFKQGSTFRRVLTWKVDRELVDLTGCSARMQWRHPETNLIIAELITEDLEYTAQEEEFAEGNIILGGTAGTITLVLPASESLTIPLTPVAKGYLYDIQITDTASEVRYILDGKIEVKDPVTR